MDFYNVKLLPKGLPEIIAQLTPYDIYPDTKVFTYPRKRGGFLGRAGYNILMKTFEIELYPTMCCSNGGHLPACRGTFSFQLWMSMLRTAAHEIGHLATREHYYDMPPYYSLNHEARNYIERLADEWADSAMERILRVDPRLGQPPGALTGYPGVLAYQFRTNHGKPWEEHDTNRMYDYHGLRCGGQLTPGDIAFYALMHLAGTYYYRDDTSRVKLGRVVRRLVHKAANELGIQRCAFSKNGRRYLMFNAGETEAVYEWLVDNRSKLSAAISGLIFRPLAHWERETVDENWDLDEINSPIEIPPEQMRLPL